MNTNDSILLHTIKQDMKRKGIEDYEIQDHTVINPSLIEVTSNEAVYITYFSTVVQWGDFDIRISSPTDSVQYTPFNTKSYGGSSQPVFSDFYYFGGSSNYESSQISKHFGNVKFNNLNPFEIKYFVRYIKVIFNKRTIKNTCTHETN